MKKKINTNTRGYFSLFFIMAFTLGNVYILIAQSTSMSYSNYVKSGAVDVLQLQRLVSEITPSVYLSNNEDMKAYGETLPVVLYTDVSSFPMLNQEKREFENVELIKILIKSPNDEHAKLDISKLISFENLKYVQLVFKYNICISNNDVCAEAITNSMLTWLAESKLKVFYVLSIPQ